MPADVRRSSAAEYPQGQGFDLAGSDERAIAIADTVMARGRLRVGVAAQLAEYALHCFAAVFYGLPANARGGYHQLDAGVPGRAGLRFGRLR